MAVSAQEDSQSDKLAPVLKDVRYKIPYTELGKHSTAGDCWVAVSGKVYDVTNWLSRHPGGQLPVINIAGQDATDVFIAFHPAKAHQMLQKFYIGELEPQKVPAVVSDYRTLLHQLEAAGLFRTDPMFYITHALTLSCFFALVVTGVLWSTSFAVHIVCAVLLGLTWNQCSFIGHDTCHNAISGKRTLDTYIGLLVGNTLTGVGIAWWKKSHNVHHVTCNSLDYDPDLQHVPLFAVSTKYFASMYSNYHFRLMEFDYIARAFVSIQHWTFYPVMAVARVNMYAQTAIVMFSNHKIANRSLHFACLGLFWLWFGLLLSRLPSTLERAAFAFVCHCLTGILHVQVTLSHFPMAMYEGRQADNDFVHTQLAGTLDIECPTWMDWFHGGLQYQIEHHLFPRLPRHNLRRIKPLVQKFCKKHNIPYVSVSFLKANHMVVQQLWRAALEARDLTKPAPRLSETLTWDAMNARG